MRMGRRSFRAPFGFHPASRCALALLALFPAVLGWAQAPPQPAGRPPQVQSAWEPAVRTLGSPATLMVDLPVPSPAFFLEGDLTQGADWGPQARIARIEQELPPSFPGTVKLRVRVQVFAVGDVTLPPLTVALRTGSASQELLLAPPALHITALMPPGDQPKPPAAQPLPVPEPFPLGWVLLGVGLAALALLAAAYLLKRLRASRKAPPAPPGLKETDPDRWARQEAEKLLRSKAGAHERYAALSELLREYLEIKFREPFLEWTTSEVHEGLERRTALKGPAVTDLLGVLSLCDWVQFARHDPSPEEERLTARRVDAVLSAVARPPAQEAAP